MGKIMAMVALILGLGACTYNVYECPEDDMHNPHGVLSGKNKDNYGNSIIVPNVAGISPGVGRFLFTTGPEGGGIEDFSIIPSITQQDPKDPENMTLAISAIPVDSPLVPAVGNIQNVSLYAVLSWETAKALFGFSNDQLVTGTNGKLQRPEVLIDLQYGSVLNLPANASTRLKIRYVARTNAGGGFNAQARLPRFRINAALSYGNVTAGNATYTQFVDNTINSAAAPWTLPHGAGNNNFIVKPPFAKTLQVTWQNYRTSGPVDLLFLGIGANFVWNDVRLAAGVNPPPAIPWPNEATAVQIINQDAANDIFNVRIINQLSL